MYELRLSQKKLSELLMVNPEKLSPTGGGVRFGAIPGYGLPVKQTKIHERLAVIWYHINGGGLFSLECTFYRLDGTTLIIRATTGNEPDFYIFNTTIRIPVFFFVLFMTTFAVRIKNNKFHGYNSRYAYWFDHKT